MDEQIKQLGEVSHTHTSFLMQVDGDGLFSGGIRREAELLWGALRLREIIWQQVTVTP